MLVALRPPTQRSVEIRSNHGRGFSRDFGLGSLELGAQFCCKVNGVRVTLACFFRECFGQNAIEFTRHVAAQTTDVMGGGTNFNMREMIACGSCALNGLVPASIWCMSTPQA